MTLTFNPRRAGIMTQHARKLKSVGPKDRVETDGRADGRCRWLTRSVMLLWIELTGVCQSVLLHVGLLVEPLVAVRARVTTSHGLYCSPLLPPLKRSREQLWSTVRARVWTRVGVNQQVRGQRRRAPKRLVALRAPVHPHACSV